jgi:hypothetical protein
MFETSDPAILEWREKMSYDLGVQEGKAETEAKMFRASILKHLNKCSPSVAELFSPRITSLTDVACLEQLDDAAFEASYRNLDDRTLISIMDTTLKQYQSH